MKTARQLNNEILLERHAEHTALRLVNGANYTHIATLNKFPVGCTVFDKKGDPIELHISKLCNERAWKKYIDQLSSPLELGTLADNAIPIVCDLAKWVRAGGYSERYAYAKTRESRRFIRYACLLLAIFHFMKHKYENHDFIDKWIENEVGKIFTAQAYAEEMHKATSRAKKHDEDLADVQETIYRRYLSLLESRPFIAYEAPPALPEGAPDPLALPEDEDDE